MAKVQQRTWAIPGQRAKRKAWGFTLQLEDGRREKHYRAEWTREDAEAELAKALLQVAPAKPKGAGLTLGQACARYLTLMARKKSLANDTRIVKHLKAELGEDTPLADITADV